MNSDTPLFDAIQHVSQRFPNKTAVVSDGLSFTYSALMKQVAAVSQVLDKHTIKGHVALVSDCPISNIVVAVACARSNRTFIPCNPQLKLHQLEKMMTHCDVSMVIVDDACFSHSASFSGEVWQLSTATPVELSLLSAANCQPKSPPSSPYLITLSSGSTGAPKPIAVTQTCKLARAHQTQALYQLSDSDVVLCASPFFHSLGQRLCFVALTLGATLVCQRRFNPKQWIELVSELRVTFVISVASHLYVLKHHLIAALDKLSSLRHLVCSSAPVDTHFKHQIYQSLGCEISEIYGATEVAIATHLSLQASESKMATVGAACSNVELRILDDNLRPVPRGELGQIAVKSPFAFVEYYRALDQTRSAWSDGYFLTGDLGRMDQHGFVTYVGRIKDVIIVGGSNVYPKDIEEVLNQHDSINEVAVIGLPDSTLGETALAVCATEHPSKLLEQQLRKLARDGLASFQRPLHYRFVTELPKTASGKIDKRCLRQELNQDTEQVGSRLHHLSYSSEGASCPK